MGRRSSFVWRGAVRKIKAGEAAAAFFGDAAWLFGPFPQEKPEGYGLPLAGVYAVWLVARLGRQPQIAKVAASCVG